MSGRGPRVRWYADDEPRPIGETAAWALEKSDRINMTADYIAEYLNRLGELDPPAMRNALQRWNGSHNPALCQDEYLAPGAGYQNPRGGVRHVGRGPGGEAPNGFTTLALLAAVACCFSGKRIRFELIEGDGLPMVIVKEETVAPPEEPHEPQT